MKTSLLKQTLVWGIILWLVGYLLGIILFPFVPASMIGWIIMPLGTFMTFWVLWKRINLVSRSQYIFIGIVWTAIAVICDYFFLVQLFQPADGYYKLDVYLYYLLTFVLPVLVGLKKTR